VRCEKSLFLFTIYCIYLFEKSYKMSSVEKQVSHSMPNVLFPCAMENDDVAIETRFSDYSEEPQKVSVTRPKRSSSTYRFSEREIRKYQQARKEGRLRFPDLFMYHIQRPTEDVQREARLMRIIQEQGGKNVSPPSPRTRNPHEMIDITSYQQQTANISEAGAKINQDSKRPSLRSRVKTHMIRILPALAFAAAGFVGVLLTTGSAGIAAAVAIPTAALVYGGVAIMQRRKQRLVKNAPVPEINPAA
jgi:hypothetical protein